MISKTGKLGKLLITGADGLLGKKVATKALKAGYEVFCIVKHIPDYEINGATYISIDLSGNINVDKLPKNIDIICHFAQSSNFRNFPKRGLDIFSVNVSSTAFMLDYALRAKCGHFIFTSSGGVYANLSTILSENSPLTPISELGPYLGSKLCGEIIAQSYMSEMNISIFRPFFIYGTGQKRDMLLPRLFDRISKQLPIQLQGENGLTINPIHVNDASEVIVKSFELPQNAVLNLAGPEILNLRQISNLIGSYLQCDPVFEFNGSAEVNLTADISLLSQNLMMPIHKFSENVKDLVGE